MESQFIQYNDPNNEVLYRKCKPVTDIKSAEIQNIIVEMRQKMQGNGIGLAANQIGYGYQIFMIEFDSSNLSYPLDFASVPYQVFINPKITKASKQRVSFWHGCLSALGEKRGKLATYKEIEYQAYNQYGEVITGKLDSIAAVIFQHEFNHLLGSVYIDFDTEYMDSVELQAKFKSGELKPYQECGEEVPLLLEKYQIGEDIYAFL
ncbi:MULTISPECIES: peptide deformylase [Francisella]|uniref:Peptide deformylase n=1 Tax=Francisella opportunistica TaxID=2016517 RepID=A0A345JSG6_9GAMM|nr:MULTISPECIES: peptide deformylase [Francisella]APC92028.1 Peptide deformylase [Francisella sp. MA067296]AXH30262.1 peptide deformylase [Francisella opportunistica]AXH31903.1 peptide deformylase [Francisella opportunistica]AXH33549.1 peptide deformylase [Francisella opportunistica]